MVATSGSLHIPPPLRHSAAARTDGELQREVKARYEATPGTRFLVDVLAAVHAGPAPLRTAAAFYARFPARTMMEAYGQRPDLRARVVHAITGAAPSLLRRTAADDLARQVELLVEEDLPAEERAVRAEEDRALAARDLFLKYLEPLDLATYLPPRELVRYESEDRWWERSSETARRVLAAELKSIRRHKILADAELLDLIGNEVLERDLPLPVRVARTAAVRKAAAEGRVFTDTMTLEFNRTPDGSRDLIDDLVKSVGLAHLRRIVDRAVEVLGLLSTDAAQPADAPRESSPSVVPASAPPAPATTSALRQNTPAFPLVAVTPSRPPPAQPALAKDEAAGVPTTTTSTGALPLVELVDDDSFGEERTAHGKNAADALPDLGDMT